MARRRVSIVDALLVLPWWASVVVAAIAYGLLSFATPAYLGNDTFARGITTVTKAYAPYVAGFFLLIGLVSFVRTHIIRRTFNGLETIEQVRQLSWRQFESIIGEAFRRRGYMVVENAVDGPDGGVDLVLHKNGAKFYVQCKHWKYSKVGVKPVRELYGVIAAADAAGGFFIASGEYTKEAREFAHTCGIELIDGAALSDMIAKARSPEPFLDPTNRHNVDTFVIEEGAIAPACPACGGEMVRRTARRGANASSAFWGCSSYPRCRGTRSA
jgi:restriction system protein